MSDTILAVAAGHEITEDEVTNLIRNYPPEQQMQMMGEGARKDVLEQLIAYHLFAKMAEDEKLTESEEYQTMLSRIKVELASHMAATKTIEGISVTEDEEKDFYQNNEDLFQAGAQVKAKHILTESQEEADKIAEQLKNEEITFEEAAKQHSTCPSKERGGDLGYFQKGQMVPEFEKAAFEGELGKVIGPVKTQFGHHLIMVEDKKETNKMEFDQVKTKIHEQLVQNKQKTVYDDKVKELEGKYGVVRN